MRRPRGGQRVRQPLQRQQRAVARARPPPLVARPAGLLYTLLSDFSLLHLFVVMFGMRALSADMSGNLHLSQPLNAHLSRCAAAHGLLKRRGHIPRRASGSRGWT